MNDYTSKLGTETRDGFIRHLKTETGLRCPVKLDFNSERVNDLYFPLRKKGNLVFVLPGGREMVRL